ncbi:MAG: peptidylprolyl isomerase [Bacteroidetes bacterium]|nr:peptidylprolyl isomerase [Bacteroidota bacterium]MBL7102852.1 peptidylprolyl isomerase [Bacteroidales bacterium]
MKKLIALLLIVNVIFITNVFSQEKKETEEKQIKILISTDYGDMTAILYNETPQHRDNFVKLINEGWYEGSPFHRVMQNFMIQGGQNADGRLDPGYTIPAEFVPGKYHKKGALAAARKSDPVNPEKASSGSQFYFVQGQVLADENIDMYANRLGIEIGEQQREAYKTIGGTPHLDGSYTVFGEVIDGMDVIDKIAAVKTEGSNKPVEDITMSIKIIE